MARINFVVPKGMTYEQVEELFKEHKLLNCDEMSNDDGQHIDMRTAYHFSSLPKNIQNKVSSYYLEEYNLDIHNDFEENEKYQNAFLQVKYDEMFNIEGENSYYLNGMFATYVVPFEVLGDENAFWEVIGDYEDERFEFVKSKLIELGFIVEEKDGVIEV